MSAQDVSDAVRSWFKADRIRPASIDAAIEEMDEMQIDWINLCKALGFAEYQDVEVILTRAHELQQAQVVGLQVSAGVHEALQRMIEDGPIKGPASEQDAILVSDWYRRITQGAPPQSSAPVAGDDVRDAARWRAVVGCARVRVLGSAGLHSDTDMYGNPHGNNAHIGLELWTKHDAGSYPEAIADFTKFADKAVAESALTGRGS